MMDGLEFVVTTASEGLVGFRGARRLARFWPRNRRRQIVERVVRTGLVVVVPEGVEQFPGVVEGDELVFVEALVAELAVEAFDVAVLGRLARGDEAISHLAFVSPVLQRPTCKLRPVIRKQTAGPPAPLRDPIQHTGRTGAGQRGVGLNPEALTGNSKQPPAPAQFRLFGGTRNPVDEGVAGRRTTITMSRRRPCSARKAERRKHSVLVKGRALTAFKGALRNQQPNSKARRELPSWISG